MENIQDGSGEKYDKHIDESEMMADQTVENRLVLSESLEKEVVEMTIMDPENQEYGSITIDPDQNTNSKLTNNTDTLRKLIKPVSPRFTEADPSRQESIFGSIHQI